MILDRMHLTNFKRFRETEIDFKNGITGIVGMNGTGKSSIVDAVFFALYGVSGGLASDFIVSSFANGEKCEVGLHFRVGTEAYYITRTFKKGKTVQHDATLTCNEGVRASGVSQVDAEVRRILGMGPTDFRSTVYAAQKDLMTLLDLTPGKRKEWFLRALGIDYLNTGSQKILKEQCDAKEKEATLLTGELAALSRQDPAELNQTRSDLADLHEKIFLLRAEDERFSAQRATLSVALQEHNLKTVKQGQLIDKEATLRTDITALAARIETLTSQAASLNVDEQDLMQLEETVKEIPKAREEIEGYRAKKAEIERITVEQRAIGKVETNYTERREKLRVQLEDLEQSEKELQVLQATVRNTLGADDNADIDVAITDYQQYVTEKVSNLNARLNANEQASNKIRANLETVREAGPEGTCPICFQRLGDHFSDVEKEYLARLDEATTEAHDLDAQLDDALHETHKIPDLKPTLDRIKQIRISLGYRELLQGELEETKKNGLEASGRMASLIKEYDAIAYNEEDHLACKQRLVELEAAQNRYTDLTKRSAQQAGIRAQIAELNSQITSKTAALTELKAAIDANSINLSEGPRLTHEVEKLDITLKTITQDLTLSIERERTATQKIADLELAAARIGTVQQQLTTLKEEIEVLKLTRTAIADYVVYIMQVVRSRIESEVSSIISEITGGKYDRVLLDEDFNLLVRENDREYTVDRFSGGEQDDIAVALRIALSRYLAELHQVHESTLLILDEIFGSQDEERRANLLTALRSQESRFPQIILISHIAEIQGEFENTLIVQGNGPISTVRAGA
jgi:exonuclease SbcC